ncbi:MAG: acetyl-CoA carboxylase biotin carboxylase subunit, partial [Phycisphaeraceae bacterium]|nr:acetyl-CoA carboxylase biotin carboxylase subunit [Phycisphaeraceae bacterium]
ESSHVRLADRAICIGPPPAAESYLNISHIISAAEVANVDAIHPGYGFLAENAHFAEVCESCNIRFIGPSVEAMRRLGDKVECKRLAVENDVPTFPGSKGRIEDEDKAVEVARDIGYPVIIKAAAGGGGRGMRVAHNDVSLRSSLHAAMAEAEAAFGDKGVYIEKFLEKARHVEVQVIGDTHGTVVHLYERDCSLQRRHQKLVEEAPCPVLDQETREKLCASAARLTGAAGYHSAGTVEFLLDDDKNFYLLEVNTRIQVEHPVSESITGVDLIKLQLAVAAGEELPFTQDDISINGHAIEARINAEDPARDFAPSPGRLEHFDPPGGPGVRVDTHCYTGYMVPPNYDSMIGKLIVHRENRREALKTLHRALGEFRVEPIKTTIPLHMDLSVNETFIQSDVDIHWVERWLSERG